MRHVLGLLERASGDPVVQSTRITFNGRAIDEVLSNPHMGCFGLCFALRRGETEGHIVVGDLRAAAQPRALPPPYGGDFHVVLASDMPARARGGRPQAQLAVTTYLVDKLALRAGGEKDEDLADTVGVCTLRVRVRACARRLARLLSVCGPALAAGGPRAARAALHTQVRLPGARATLRTPDCACGAANARRLPAVRRARTRSATCRSTR